MFYWLSIRSLLSVVMLVWKLSFPWIFSAKNWAYLLEKQSDYQSLTSTLRHWKNRKAAIGIDVKTQTKLPTSSAQNIRG